MLVIETEDSVPFERLGGTVKVGKVLEEDVTPYLLGLKRTNIDFGISSYGFSLPYSALKEIKQQLISAGVRARFVVPKPGETELSSVVVKKQKLEEFLVIKNGKELITAVTIRVQDFESWNKRDYGRPAVEPHIGMLPPKVARQMVNLGSGDQVPGSGILDPFCGVGTILMEAFEVGINAIGADIDNRQIQRTRKNLEWLGAKAELFVADARKISEKVKNVDAVVTEVDLGPKPNLNGLYLECFKDWKKFAKKVVIALPSTEVVDKVVAMGYILESGPFIYARPQAKVKRNILVFKNVTH